MIRVST